MFEIVCKLMKKLSNRLSGTIFQTDRNLLFFWKSKILNLIPFDFVIDSTHYFVYHIFSPAFNPTLIAIVDHRSLKNSNTFSSYSFQQNEIENEIKQIN